MDNKFYVSLEAARLLKEKGYSEKCTFAYAETSNGSDINGRIVFNSNDYPVGFYPCPTKAEAIDWLDSKGIVVEIWRPNFSTGWACSVEKNRILEYDSWMKDDILFPTRLEAEEAAIIKALELL
jgi:hypothetical protein